MSYRTQLHKGRARNPYFYYEAALGQNEVVSRSVKAYFECRRVCIYYIEGITMSYLAHLLTPIEFQEAIDIAGRIYSNKLKRVQPEAR